VKGSLVSVIASYSFLEILNEIYFIEVFNELKSYSLKVLAKGLAISHRMQVQSYGILLE